MVLGRRRGTTSAGGAGGAGGSVTGTDDGNCQSHRHSGDVGAGHAGVGGASGAGSLGGEYGWCGRGGGYFGGGGGRDASDSCGANLGCAAGAAGARRMSGQPVACP